LTINNKICFNGNQDGHSVGKIYLLFRS